MKRLLVAIGAFLALLSPANAQSVKTFNNFIQGLPGASTPPSSNDQLYLLQNGASRKIPFSALNSGGGGGGGGGGGVANFTRAQIPTLDLSSTPYFTVNGYRVANDLGYGATYTSINADCSSTTQGQSPAWIKDVKGVCFGLVTNNFNRNPDNWGTMFNITQVNLGWFGCYGDDGNEQITAQDITNNPQWRGQWTGSVTTTPYTVGTTWDAVCTQEAIYAAFAQNSYPGHVSFNPRSIYGNSGIYIPPGLYDINITITAAMQGFVWRQEGRDNITTSFKWTGATAQTLFRFDSASYGTFENLVVSCTAYVDFSNTTSPQPPDTPCVAFDHTGADTGSLHTQQLTFINLQIGVGGFGEAISFQPTGGNQQADTITFINPIFTGNSQNSFYALEINGANALQYTIIGGDCQGFIKDCVRNIGGQFTAYDFHQENESSCQLFNPCLNQINTSGASLHSSQVNAGNNGSLLMSIRDESTVLSRADTGVPHDIYNANTTDGSNFGWFANYTGYTPGMQILGGTLNRKFMVVDGGGACQQWCAITGGFGTQVLQDNAASYGVNALAGLAIQLRYGSNGFTVHCIITSNTANTITLPNGCGLDTQVSYMITGASAGSAPTWDTATTGYRMDGDFKNVGDLVNTYAGTTCVGVNEFINNGSTINIGDYLILPFADRLSPVFPSDGASPVWAMPLYAKVTAGPVHAACAGQTNPWSVTVDKTAKASIDYGVFGLTVYGCTPISDGAQGLKWCQIPFDSVYGVKRLDNVNVVSGYIGGAMSESRVFGFQTSSFDHVLDPLQPANYAPQPGSFNDITIINGSIQEPQCVLTPAATIDVSLDTVQGCNIGTASNLAITPGANTTLNAVKAPEFKANARARFVIKTTGFTVTFGTNFESMGPVPAAIQGAINYTYVDFISEFGVWREVGRGLLSGGQMLQVTIANLPTCNNTNLGMLATITNGVTPTIYSSVVTATGSTNNLVYCNAVAWTYH